MAKSAILQAVVGVMLGLLALLALVHVSDAYSSDFKVKKLNELIKKSGPALVFDSAAFDRYTEAPRNYSIFVLLTALDPRVGCEVCKNFQPEFELTASSWDRVSKGSHIYFATLDFKDGQEVYQRLGLRTAPTLIHFPPTEGGAFKAEIQESRYDFQRGITADDFASFVESTAGVKLPVYRPPNYTLIIVGSLAVLIFAASLKLLWPYLVAIFLNHHIWALISLGIILLMTSGHMWNHIRKPPYVIADQQNRPQYIVGGFQNQIGIESQIAAAINGGCALAFVFLATYVPSLKSASAQRTAAYAGIAGLYLAMSLLFMVFRIKSGGYPFRLLF